MSDSFNPYTQWLGLPPGTQRPNHYVLLGLSPGESDAKKISLAAEQAATRIRSFRPGPQAADWARLLDEVQQAKVALLDPARKAEYDRGLSIKRSSTSAPVEIAASPLADLFPPGFRSGASAPASVAAPVALPAAAAAAVPNFDPSASLMAPCDDLPPPAQATPGTNVPVGYPMPLVAAPASYPQVAYASAMAVDPMAPVAVPGVTAGYPSAPMAMGYPACAPIMPMPMAVPVAQPVAQAIAQPFVPPAVYPVAAPLTAPAAPAAIPSPAQETEAVGVRKASAAAVMMAARKERQTRNAALLAGGVAGLVIVAGLASYMVMMQRRDKSADKQLAQNDSKENDARPTKPDRETKKPSTTVTEDSKNSSDTPAVDPMPMPKPTEVQRPPMPEPSPTPEQMPKPEPKPEPTPMAKPTKEQVAQLEAALKKARLALSEQSFDDAEAEAVKAEKVAVLPEHQALVERLRLAIDHTRLFRQALAEAAGKLEAAETIKVGSSTVVAIVETFPDKITVRVNGMNRAYSFANIPPGLAAAILDTKRIGGEPDSRILKAMFVATAKDADESDVADARGWLQEVQSSDPNAAALLMFLDDSYEGLLAAFEASEKNAAAGSAAASAVN